MGTSNSIRRKSRLASNLALAACLSMAATPALAGGGWGGGGWGRGHHHGHHRDNDAGWIIGGIIGIGILAAMASSASKANKEREARQREGGYPERDYRGDGGDYRGGDYRGEPRGGYGERRDEGYRPSAANRGIDGAVDTCVSEVERGSTRVDTVDSVDRDGEGWRVEGKTNGGKSFACTVGNSGRIRSVTVDGKAALADEELDRQEG